MESEADIKQEVREFYDQIGWRMVGEGLYQNARYEDLRPVSREYIHKCHLRVARHLKPAGEFFLDAGSGPIQYPEYVEYSQGYRRRVCADLSISALREARQRIGGHGLFVVADIAHLPFATGVFEAVVSLHTIHHLPLEQHAKAYQEIYRMLSPGSRAVVVNGWRRPPLVQILNRLRKVIEAVRYSRLWFWTQPRRRRRKKRRAADGEKPRGTFVEKSDAAWLKREVGARMPLEIFVWRSLNTSALRYFIREKWAGRFWLRLLYALEERFPHFIGQNASYPLIVIRRD